MNRANIDGKGQAVDGDVTTTGAVCIASGSSYIYDGRKVLRVGDVTTRCPRCGKAGVVVEGVPWFTSDGQAVVMDGAQVTCGCPSGSNRVMAPLHDNALHNRTPGVATPVARPGTRCRKRPGIFRDIYAGPRLAFAGCARTRLLHRAAQHVR